MEQETTLKDILNDLCATLVEMSAIELAVFATQWNLLKSYAEQSDSQYDLFYTKLIEITQKSPTLTYHGFPDVLAHSTRFLDEPAPNHNQPSSTQGIPPVHNEIVQIAEKIQELLSQSKPKA